MRAHLLTVFSPFEHGSGLVFTLFACPQTENGCNSNLKFWLRVHKEREVDMHGNWDGTVHTMHRARKAELLFLAFSWLDASIKLKFVAGIDGHNILH